MTAPNDIKPPEDEAWLSTAITMHGLALRPEDAAATLATGRFLAEAARRVRDAAA